MIKYLMQRLLTLHDSFTVLLNIEDLYIELSIARCRLVVYTFQIDLSTLSKVFTYKKRKQTGTLVSLVVGKWITQA